MNSRLSSSPRNGCKGERVIVRMALGEKSVSGLLTRKNTLVCDIKTREKCSYVRFSSVRICMKRERYLRRDAECPSIIDYMRN